MDLSITRRTVSATALAVGVWVLLAGLFTMHALPMQQPQAMTAAMATPTPSVSVAMTVHHPSASVDGGQLVGAVRPAGVDPVAAGLDGTMPAEQQAAPVPTAGCEGADHCTATLRTPDTSTAPAVITVAAAAAPIAHRTVLPAPAAPQSRPPDLDTLQISRT